MFVPFETLPPTAKIWVYQSDRPFTSEEVKIIHERLRAFTDEWSVHGSPLPTSYAVKFDQFIVLAADETHESASGCSIDSSVRVLKSLEQMLDLRLFDRNQVAFRIGDDIVLVPLADLKQKFANSILKEDTLTFNNLVSSREAFDKEWSTPVGKTWLKRYMSDPLVKVQ